MANGSGSKRFATAEVASLSATTLGKIYYFVTRWHKNYMTRNLFIIKSSYTKHFEFYFKDSLEKEISNIFWELLCMYPTMRSL